MPATAESKIRSETPNNQLRPEFIKAVDQLREKIYFKISPKVFKGTNLNSRMFCSLLESYVHSINVEGVPNLESAWENIISRECEAGMVESKEVYDANW